MKKLSKIKKYPCKKIQGLYNQNYSDYINNEYRYYNTVKAAAKQNKKGLVSSESDDNQVYVKSNKID